MLNPDDSITCILYDFIPQCLCVINTSFVYSKTCLDHCILGSQPQPATQPAVKRDRMWKSEISESAVIHIVVEDLKGAFLQIQQYLDSLLEYVQQNPRGTSSKVRVPATEGARGPLTPEEKARRRTQDLCFYCGGPLHRISACPLRPPKPGTKCFSTPVPVKPVCTKPAPAKTTRLVVKTGPTQPKIATPTIKPTKSSVVKPVPALQKKTSSPIKKAPKERPLSQPTPRRSRVSKPPAPKRVPAPREPESRATRLAAPRNQVTQEASSEESDQETPTESAEPEFDPEMPMEQESMDAEPAVPMEIEPGLHHMAGVARDPKSSPLPPCCIYVSPCPSDDSESEEEAADAAFDLVRQTARRTQGPPGQHKGYVGVAGSVCCPAGVTHRTTVPYYLMETDYRTPAVKTISHAPCPRSAFIGALFMSPTVVRLPAKPKPQELEVHPYVIESEVERKPEVAALHVADSPAVAALHVADSPAVAALHVADSPAVAALQPAGFQEPCCTEVQVQEPCCTEVQEPCCTEVQVQEPCCTEVQVQEPCCTEVQVQEPCCTEVQVQEPCCTEVQVQEPCCTEVQVQEPCCAEVQVQEPCCTEAQVQEPCCTEVQVQEPCCAQVQTAATKTAFVDTDTTAATLPTPGKASPSSEVLVLVSAMAAQVNTLTHTIQDIQLNHLFLQSQVQAALTHRPFTTPNLVATSNPKHLDDPKPTVPDSTSNMDPTIPYSVQGIMMRRTEPPDVAALQPAESQDVADLQPAGSPEVTVPHPAGSPEVAVKHPAGSPEVAAKHPAGSPEVAAKHPAGSPEVAAKHPAGSPEVAAKHPAGSPEVAAKHPAGSPEVAAKHPAGSPEVSSPRGRHRRRKAKSFIAAAEPCLAKDAAAESCSATEVAKGAAPPLLVKGAAPPLLVKGAAPPLLVKGAAPPLLVKGAAPPLLAKGAAPPLLVKGAAPPLLAKGAAPPLLVKGAAPLYPAVAVETPISATHCWQFPALAVPRRVWGFSKVDSPIPHSRKFGLYAGQPSQDAAHLGTIDATPDNAIPMDPYTVQGFMMDSSTAHWLTFGRPEVGS
uniref:Uncharacterized protein n=1 Tax=Leptobrachium leishanense TaxID=445787 RepID=A0A8C5LKF7_9ANUR